MKLEKAVMRAESRERGLLGKVTYPTRKTAAASQRTPPRTTSSDTEASTPGQRDVFAELSRSEREAFLENCKEQHFQPGSRLFSQGDRYAASYLIRSGIVRTYYVSPTGKEITVAYWSEGALVGGPNVFNEKSLHIWSAQAITPATTLAIKGRDLEAVAMKVPALAHYLIDTLTFKLHWVSVLLQMFGTESVRCRLAHLLLQLGEHYGTESDGGTMIKHYFSHEELARMVGATRSWVSITLGSLKNDRVLTCRGRHLVISDKQGLKDIIRSAR